MKQTLVCPSFLAVTLLSGFGAGPAFAQYSDALGINKSAPGIDVPIRQGIAMDLAPSQGTANIAATRTTLHGATKDVSTEASSEGLAGRSRLLCEQRQRTPAAEWKCRPHASGQ
ncbi:hypothetical protein Q8A64_02835 [Oxalobacteraceae bacterium R-40]|uniref:Uncharacterized protein n=1 Tax=Keguizhuia sedimenti TaxID=3064264 RepID=A0ABU1BMR0_9BURK|nr:hypothetical protein [Oxalobacteraceae bacterium R-40]